MHAVLHSTERGGARLAASVGSSCEGARERERGVVLLEVELVLRAGHVHVVAARHKSRKRPDRVVVNEPGTQRQC